MKNWAMNKFTILNQQKIYTKYHADLIQTQKNIVHYFFKVQGKWCLHTTHFYVKIANLAFFYLFEFESDFKCTGRSLSCKAQFVFIHKILFGCYGIAIHNRKLNVYFAYNHYGKSRLMADHISQGKKAPAISLLCQKLTGINTF